MSNQPAARHVEAQSSDVARAVPSPIYRVRANGTPAPKGSLKCVGRGKLHQLVEDDKTGARRRWRKILTNAGEPLAARLGEPLDGPIVIGVLLSIPRPPSNRTALPTTRSAGDVDKHARMALDCLDDAGIYTDDSRAVLLLAGKVWAEQPERAGAVVYISEASFDAASRILQAMREESPALDHATLF